ncbi:MAG: hypothetical protein U9N77_11545 [Thermodesulfobacteriota bacterium]|nr:hypothetical protein [Thermodesulfobacteriota bacterium]
MEEEPGKKMAAGARDTDKTIEVLLEISNALSSTFNLDELYKAIHKSLGKIINVDNFFISILDQKRDSIFFPYWIDEEDDVHGEIFNFSKSASLTAMAWTIATISDISARKNAEKERSKSKLPLPYRDSGFLKSCNTCRVVAFEKSSDFEKA